MPDTLYNACYVGTNEDVLSLLREAWGPDTAQWTFYGSGRDAVDVLLTSPPDIFVCSLTLPDMPGAKVISLLKEENVYSQVPVLLCLPTEATLERVNWRGIMADDFFIVPSSAEMVRARLDLAMGRVERTLDANPLTRLPGNTSIIKHTQALINKNQDFALGYCDLDFFKPFNDKYGFARGDEVLMMTARVILNAVHDLTLPFSFVGHIGGDDFVFIVPMEAAEPVCKKIVAAFDAIIPQFYDQEDLDKGCIISMDRQNTVCSFPLMGISVAVVFNKGNLKHYGEVSSLATSMKKVAKQSVASSYVLDRRQS